MNIETARITDIEALADLRESISLWLKTEKKIHQWLGPQPRASVERGIAEGEIHVVREAGRVIAALTIDRRVSPLWRDLASDDALYLHRLMLERSHWRQGLGRKLMAWVESELRRQQVPLLRLDCDATNSWLRAYYLDLGFTSLGVREDKRYEMSLEMLEKRIG